MVKYEIAKYLVSSIRSAILAYESRAIDKDELAKELVTIAWEMNSFTVKNTVVELMEK